MKQIGLTGLLPAAVMVMFILATPIGSQEKTQIAVVEFNVKGLVPIEDAGSIAAEWLSTSLAKTGKYQLYERILLQKVVEEQKLGMSGLVDEESAAKVGKLYGVPAIVAGSIIGWEGVFSLTARIIDTETGKVLSSADYKTRDTTKLAEAVDKIALVLAGEMTQEALTRENPSLSKNDLKQMPILIIKIFEKGGQLKAALNRGLNHNIRKWNTYAVYVPEYNVSEITGEKSVTGVTKAGTITLDNLEPDMSSGCLLLKPKYKADTELVLREGFAVPSFVTLGVQAGSYNAGAAVGFYSGGGRYSNTFDVGYVFSLLDFPPGIVLNYAFLFSLFGNASTVFSFQAGVTGLMHAGFFGIGVPEDSPYKDFTFFGGGPIAELTFYNAYLRAGVAFGGVSFVGSKVSFAYTPVLQLGYVFKFDLIMK
jgi:hypothetical protein